MSNRSTTTQATRKALEEMCARKASANDPSLPLFRAAADGAIALAWVLRPEADWPFAAVAAVDRPAVFLIADDPYPAGVSRGPRGWPIAKRIRKWCRAAIVHGAAGEAHHYREAVVAAKFAGRCVMVETDSAHVQAWASYLRCPATLLIIPEGGKHPVPGQEVMH